MKIKNKQVKVIGAGLGGLSAGLALASKGFQVEIYEKNPQAGGKLNRLEKEGFSFDLGPSIFTLPQFFQSLFARAGKSMKDYFEIVPVTPHWRNFFEDGTVLDLFHDPKQMEDELRQRLPNYQPDVWKQFQAFLSYSQSQYDFIQQGYFEHGLDTLFDLFRFHGPIQLGLKVDFCHRMAGSIKKYIQDPYLRMIFEYFIKYVGSSAYNAPGFMNLMPHIQFKYDLWYVKGGMYNIARGLTRLAQELGVTIHYSSEVKKIEKRGKKIQGIVVEGKGFQPADYVVCNMEVIPAYQKLLDEPQGFVKKLNRFEPACSGLVVHLGTDKIYPELAHHNFFFSQNQTQHFDTVFNQLSLPEDPTLYVVAPTRTDPSQAPKGCDNIKVLPHIPYLHPQKVFCLEDYQALKERVIAKLERMGLKDLHKHIIVEDFWTPFDIERQYYSNGGSIYGVVSDWKKNRGFKAPKQSSKYENLFFVGGSVNPGGGMPMVMLCGQNVCDKIVKQEEKSM